MTSEIQEKNKPQRSSVARNVLLSLASIIAICLLIFFGYGEGVDAEYAYAGAMLISLVTFPLLCLLTGASFFMARRKKEGKALLIAAGAFVLVLLFLLLPYLT